MKSAPAKSASSSSRQEKNGTASITLRVPLPMLTEIDKALRKHPYKMPRHMWLLEAIHEKLSRLKSDGKVWPACPK